jgi:preprotein translocase subunit SecF
MTMLNILGKRYLYFLLSLIIIVPGFIVMAIYGMPLAIDFTGGSLLEVKFNNATLPSTADVVQVYNDMGITDIKVTTSGNDLLIIRSTFLDETQRAKVVTSMESKFNTTVEIQKFDSVGPTIGEQVTKRAGLAIAVAALGVVLFITFAFRGIQNALRYGICAVIAMLHDILLVVSISAIGGHFFGWQVDSLFLTALLTVIGFSVQDKIVVFDRVRENSNIFRKLDFEKLVNHSIVQTLQRSINTQLMTSEFLLLALALFGGVTLREFAVILLVGLFSGTYSSIFIAAPILVVWEKREWKTWFHRNPATTSA